MTVQFNIEYKAMFGEQIVVNIQTEEGGLKLPLETTDGERWACDWGVESPEKSYTYYYSVEREGRAVKTEWLMIKHQLDVNAKKAAVYTLYDHWKAMPEDAFLYSSAFTDCINHQVPQEMKPETGSKIVRLIVRAPQLRDGERLGVLGADKALGAWDVQKILPMTQHTYNEWVADINATHLEGSHLEFKFVAFRNAKDDLLWEAAMNRTVDLPEMKADAAALDIKITAQEIALYLSEKKVPPEHLEAIKRFIAFLRKNQRDKAISALLQHSRIPQKEPSTFENFDFSRVTGEHAAQIRNLPNLTALYSRQNIAFIGPPGVGKTHLSMAYGNACCQKGLKAYFIKATELNEKFTKARRTGTESSAISGLVRPSCLIIDEIGRSIFDMENTRLFFDMIDRRCSKEGPNCMIFTSNLTPDKWRDFFREEDSLLCALDRTFDAATVYLMKGESYRGRNLKTYSIEISDPTE